MALVIISPVDLGTLTDDGTFRDLDVSSSVPAGSTGVLLRWVGDNSTNTIDLRIRKNGSTDNSVAATGCRENVINPIIIGVDSSRIFEYSIASTANSNGTLYLVGYFTGSVETFFTNTVTKNAGVDNAWTDVSIASDTGADTAVAAFLGGNTNTGASLIARKNGSSDNRVNTGSYTHGNSCIVGVDGSEIYESYESSLANWQLKGYATGEITMHTNRTDVSLSSTGSYTDLSALPSAGGVGFYEILNTNTTNTGYIRAKGDSQDHSAFVSSKSMFICQTDSSGLVEGKISSTSVDFYEAGYYPSTGRRRNCCM